MATMSTSVVNGDYRPRAEKIPTPLDDVTPEWLTHTLQHRCPDGVVKGFEQAGLTPSIPTNLRLWRDLTADGREAGMHELDRESVGRGRRALATDRKGCG